jgi:NAD(P)-dependent dehydrogenase (short-subunit alcohol dehydrogenase family)
MTFEGEAILVTGSSSGIGRACVERLLRLGARVAGIDVARATLDVPGYVHLEADVRDEAAVERCLDQAQNALGGLHGVVNAAGIFASGARIVDLTLASWERVIGTNLTGTFLVSRAAARRMVPVGRGKIVNVACIRGSVVRQNMAEYTASKGGVAALTAALAADLAPHNIQVNAVAPGFTWTAMTNRAFSDPQVRAASEKLIPAGRIAQPEDIAGPVTFLLSRDADYVTGEVLFVDGGFARSK